MFIHSEAILLSSNPFEENKWMVDLFCQELGLIKIFVYKSPGEPFTLMETVLQKGRGDYYYLKETKILDSLPKERTPLTLEISHRLKQALMDHTRDPKIYALFKAFLQHLHLAQRPKNLLASFLLKLLSHEGRISLEPGKEATCFSEGEWFTPATAPAWSLHFSDSEIEDLLTLAKSRSLLVIDEKEISERLLMKINQLISSI